MTTMEERQHLVGDGYGQDDAGDLSGIESTAVRHGFIQKVYGILSVQLAVTTLVGGVVMKSAESMVHSNPGLTLTLMMLSFAATISVMCVFMCCPDTMRSSPTNYILLSVFTLAESVLVGFISSSYTQESVLIVLGITTIVVLSLTLFACQTKYDFTGLAPYFFCASMVLFSFGFVLMLCSWCGLGGSPAFSTLRLVYACGGALLFSGYIVFDTQLIVGGKHAKYQFSLDDYCMAAINLYLDIIQLFMFLLEIFGDRR